MSLILSILVFPNALIRPVKNPEPRNQTEITQANPNRFSKISEWDFNIRMELIALKLNRTEYRGLVLG